MNAQRKKAAVTKYLPLIIGKSEEEVKALLAADTKAAYTEAEIAEIYQELLKQPDPTPAAPKVKVQVNYGVEITELRQSLTKEEIEADQSVIDYLIEIKSGAVTVLQEDKE
jgi:hypothetical protein